MSLANPIKSGEVSRSIKINNSPLVSQTMPWAGQSGSQLVAKNIAKPLIVMGYGYTCDILKHILNRSTENIDIKFKVRE